MTGRIEGGQNLVCDDSDQLLVTRGHLVAFRQSDSLQRCTPGRSGQIFKDDVAQVTTQC